MNPLCIEIIEGDSKDALNKNFYLWQKENPQFRVFCISGTNKFVKGVPRTNIEGFTKHTLYVAYTESDLKHEQL